MTRLLSLTMLTVTLFVAQPAQAQQQDTKKNSMEMMQDSTMMQKMMENPQMHKKMMRMMMKHMHGDSAMSGMKGMMGDGMSGMCMKMCMNMMDNMKEGMDMDMQNMPEDKNSDAKMKKSEG